MSELIKKFNSWREGLVLRKQLIDTAGEINGLGINQGKSGNLSIRIPGGMLITPGSISYQKIKPYDLVALDLNGNAIKSKNKGFPKRPSSEWKLHAEIYHNRTEVNAIIHCHSINATALSCHNKEITSFHYMTAIAGGKTIRCAEYATFGSSDLPKKTLKALEGRLACLLAHHGQIAIAPSLEKALEIAIEVETLSNIYLKALQIGPPNNIDSNEMEKVIEKFNLINYK